MLNIYQLEQHIKSRLRTAPIPGLALAIVRDVEVIYAQGFGVTSVEDGGLPVTPQTIFYIASTAKPLTGTAIMQLVEAGKLELDRPIKEYVPWLSFREKDAAERITLRMLMSHTAGLPSSSEYFGSRDVDGIERHVREQLCHYNLIAPHGKLYAYSNDGVVLAGYLAQLASGQPFAELMQALVFDPLAMKRTTYDPTVAMTYPIAQEHDLHEDGTFSVLHRFAYNTAYQPSGFLLSTVLDLANFAIMQMNSGSFLGRQLLTPASITAMQTPQVSFHTVKNEGYGLTFRIDTYKGKRVIVHNGIFRATTSMFSMLPETKIAVIMLFNGFYAGSGVDGIIHSIYDQLLELPLEAPGPRAIKADRALWPQFVGSYLGLLGGLATIKVVDNCLTLDLNGTMMLLKAFKRDLYFSQQSENGPIVSVGFLLEEDGSVQYITINGSFRRRFERETSFVANPSEWQAYVGTYVGSTGTLLVRLAEDHLCIFAKEDKMDVRCLPLDNSSFVGALGLIDFVRDDDGKVASIRRARMFTYKRA